MKLDEVVGSGSTSKDIRGLIAEGLAAENNEDKKIDNLKAPIKPNRQSYYLLYCVMLGEGRKDDESRFGSRGSRVVGLWYPWIVSRVVCVRWTFCFSLG